MNFPADPISWREVDSSNVRMVGWDRFNNMYVVFGENAMYEYVGVSRQRAVATAYAKSVGQYINRVIKPNFKAVRLV